MIPLPRVVTAALVLIAGFVFLLLYGPLFVAIFFSFFRLERNEVQWDSFSFSAYEALTHNRGILDALMNTLIVGGSAVALSLVFGTLLAFRYHARRSTANELLQLIIFLPFFLILALAIWRSGVWERRVIREELAGEVGRTVSADEYHDIVGDRMFRTRRIDAARPRTSAALVNAQHELAFRKRRVRDEGNDPERDDLVAGWRDDVRRLRAALRPAPESSFLP